MAMSNGESSHHRVFKRPARARIRPGDVVVKVDGELSGKRTTVPITSVAAG
jgi:hypothetical protein